MINGITNSIAFFTLLADIVILVLFILYLGKLLFKLPYIRQVQKKIAPQALYGVFLISLLGMLGSLFLSEVAKIPPCVLCWYQRIFLYPQPLLLYMSFIRNENFLSPYLLMLNIIGAGLAFYHYLIQLNPSLSFIPCQIGNSTSCTLFSTLYYGYITIPMMAQTAFIINIILLLFAITNKNSKKHTK